MDIDLQQFDFFYSDQMVVERPTSEYTDPNVTAPRTLDEILRTRADFQDQGTALRRAQNVHEEAVAIVFSLDPVDDVQPQDLVSIPDRDPFTVLEVRTLDHSLVVKQ